MLRVRRITASPPSGMGGQGIEVPGAGLDLAAFDLVIVFGPNGSGKSLLTGPLREPPAGLLLVDPAGSEQVFGRGRTLGFDRGLLVRTSVDLLTEFSSLKTALGKAAGITRAADEARILDKLVAPRGQYSLVTLRPEPNSEVPLAIRQSRDDFRHVERRVLAAVGQDVPLSLAAYNALGRQVAGMTGRSWVEQAAIDDVSMRSAEEAVRPAAVVIRGSGDLTAACHRAMAALRGPDESLVSAVEQAERTLAGAVDAAALLAPLQAGEARPAAEAWSDRCRKAAGDLRRMADEDERLITTLDALARLRREAVDLIDHGGRSTCPVCDAAVDQQRLLETLRAAVATTAPDLESRRRQVAQRRELARRLEGAADKVESAGRGVADRTRGVEETIGQWAGAVTALTEAVIPRAEWDGRVKPAAENLREMSRDAGRGIEGMKASGPLARLTESAACVARVREAAAAAVKSLESLDRTANQGLAEAERVFNQLVPLRELLVCRRAFNARRWEPTWERDRDDQVRNGLVDVWIRAAEGLRDERQRRLADTEAEILGHPAVQQRFRALLDSLGHPLLQGVDLAAEAVVQGGGVVIGGRKRDSRLSEGYTVLVNLAAFVAVAGYVADGQEHEPGWVILDEPTNGLDVENRRRVAEYIGGLDRTLMPRQIFVTTCDDAFRRILVAAATAAGRRTLELHLPPWQGRVSAPVSIDHRTAGAT